MVKEDGQPAFCITAIVGDITPHCGVSPEEKKRLEADAIQRMVDMVGPSTAAGMPSAGYNQPHTCPHQPH